ncbi:unnamed protein product [Cyprideis torosa]|uniref:Uncharacterized protein n=1 Tax=Cyprideis torosa TaxID=163714 RepID=A0A7R8ZIX1_9CRUS|nr:unnamed protein product [Cyprideis torosa]CAG0885640.1 unnamed protein product [Cyprideis torosa]
MPVHGEWQWSDLLHPVTLLETLIYGSNLRYRATHGEDPTSVRVVGRRARTRVFGRNLTLIEGFVRNASRNDEGKILETVLENIPIYGKRCYDPIGCLEINSGWYHFLYRPVNVFPLERDMLGTRFLLWTRKNFRRFHELRSEDLDTFLNASFDGTKPIKFIIHGFIDTGETTWVRRMAEGFLRREDCNAISVDWGGGSLPPYTQATANIRMVALEMIYLIKVMENNFGVHPSQIHIVGHSLGAHTGAYVGQEIPGIARITGLDPSEPYFQGMEKFVRLDPDDAEFVDVIHTDANSIFLFGLGMSQPCGHLDFFPNGGKSQPVCKLGQIPLTLMNEGVEQAGRDIVACNHQGAIRYFSESLLTECPFLGYECDSHEDFLEGRCSQCGADNSRCAQMGYEANLYPNHRRRRFVRMFLVTNDRKPYCLYQYIVKVTLASPFKARTYLKGHLDISIEGSEGFIRLANLTQKDTPTELEHGKSYSFVIGTHEYVGNITQINLHWQYYESYTEPSTYCFYVCNPNLYVRRVVISHYFQSKPESYEEDFTGRTSRESPTPARIGRPSLQGFCDDNSDFVEIPDRSFGTFRNHDYCV